MHVVERTNPSCGTGFFLLLPRTGEDFRVDHSDGTPMARNSMLKFPVCAQYHVLL